MLPAFLLTFLVDDIQAAQGGVGSGTDDCSKRLGEELLKLQGEEGPPPRF